LSKIFLINSFTLYFKIIPPLLILGFSLVFFLFVQNLFNNEQISFWALFFCLLGGSFSYLIPLCSGINKQWSESSFWVSQTFSNLINQHLVVSLILFFTINTLLLKYLRQNKKVFLSYIFILIIILPFIKSYAGVVAFLGLGVLGIKRLFKNKDISLILTVVIGLIVVLTIYYKLNLSSGFPFFFSPGWFLKSMVEASDRLDLPILALREEYYSRANNYLGIIVIRILEFFIFFIGNLGTRIIGLANLLFFWIKEKKERDIHLFFATIFIFSTLFPLFFLQQGVVWNSIQFWYYALPIVSIYAGESFFSYFKNIQLNYYKVTVIIFLIILTLPTSLKTFLDQTNPKKMILIPNDLLRITKYLDKNSQKNSVIVIEPKGIQFFSSIVYLLSKREVFLSDPHTLEITMINYKNRLNKLEAVFEKKTDFLTLKQIEPRVEFVLRENIDKIQDKKKNKQIEVKQEKLELNLVLKTNKYLLLKYK